MAEQTDFSPAYYRTIKVIDTFTEWTGKTVAFVCVPLALTVFWEVVTRSFIGQATTWAYELSYMLYSVLFMLGAHYALLRGAHIRTDMLWERFSERTKGRIDFYAFIFLFFPGMILLFGASVDDAWRAFTMGERSDQTAWRPYLWPMKAVVPLTAVLLLVQGTSEIMKSWFAMRTGRAFEHKAGGEI